MRFTLLFAVLTVSGCQCYVPVGQFTDAGTMDAGVPDGGNPTGTCTTAADCGVGRPGQTLCPTGGSTGTSCIDHRCIFECSAARVCAFNASTTCLDCTGAANACLNPSCGMQARQGQVETTTCSNQGFTDVVLQAKGTGCQWTVATDDGDTGTVSQLNDGYVGVFPGLGTCVGVSLQTQVERVVFSCEGCQFVLRI